MTQVTTDRMRQEELAAAQQKCSDLEVEQRELSAQLYQATQITEDWDGQRIAELQKRALELPFVMLRAKLKLLRLQQLDAEAEHAGLAPKLEEVGAELKSALAFRDAAQAQLNQAIRKHSMVKGERRALRLRAIELDREIGLLVSEASAASTLPGINPLRRRP